jgi:hypothetical protein
VTATRAEPAVERRPWWRHPAVRLLGSAAVLGLLFVALPFADIRAAIARMPVMAWPVALAIYLLLHFVGVVKWRLVVNAAGGGLGLRDATRAYYMGLFGNTFLPSIVGGDVVRAGVAFRAVRSRSGLILGSLIDRLQDILALGVVAGVGALLSPRALDAQSRRIFLALAGLLTVVGVVGALALVMTPVHRLPWKVRRLLVRIRSALRATAASPSALVTAFFLGALLQSLLTVLNWWLGRSIGIDIPIYVWLFVWPLAKIAGLLPLTQNGIGVREAAQAVLFAPFGVSAANAVATGLVFEVVILSGGMFGGALAWLLSRTAIERSGLREGATART